MKGKIALYANEVKPCTGLCLVKVEVVEPWKHSKCEVSFGSFFVC